MDKKNFLTPILMKPQIFNPYGLRILEFHQNQSQKFFLIKRGGPFYLKKKILSLILLKLCVSDPETICISNFNSYPNRRQIFFSDPKGGPFYVKNILF